MAYLAGEEYTTPNYKNYSTYKNDAQEYSSVNHSRLITQNTMLHVAGLKHTKNMLLSKIMPLSTLNPYLINIVFLLFITFTHLDP